MLELTMKSSRVEAKYQAPPCSCYPLIIQVLLRLAFLMEKLFMDALLMSRQFEKMLLLFLCGLKLLILLFGNRIVFNLNSLERK